MSNRQELSFSVSDLSPDSIAAIRQHLAALKVSLAQGQTAGIKLGRGKELPLPEALLDLLIQAFAKAADGKKIRLVEEDETVSPEKAAAFMGVSRPYLVKQLAAGEMPFHWVGTHRRVLMSDLVAYKGKRRERGRELLRQMREEAEELGLYE